MNEQVPQYLSMQFDCRNINWCIDTHTYYDTSPLCLSRPAEPQEPPCLRRVVHAVPSGLGSGFSSCAGIQTHLLSCRWDVTWTPSHCFWRSKASRWLKSNMIPTQSPLTALASSWTLSWTMWSLSVDGICSVGSVMILFRDNLRI